MGDSVDHAAYPPDATTNSFPGERQWHTKDNALNAIALLICVIVAIRILSKYLELVAKNYCMLTLVITNAKPIVRVS